MEYEGYQGQVVFVKGIMTYYGGRPNLTIEQMKIMDDGTYELSEVCQCLAPEKEQIYRGQIKKMFSMITDTTLNKFCRSVLNEEMINKMAVLPVHLKGHHTYSGALLEHTCEVTIGALYLLRSTEAIRTMQCDLNLVITGALLHDISSTVRISQKGYGFCICNNYKMLGDTHAGQHLLNVANQDRLLDATTFALVSHIVDSSHIQSALPCTMEAMAVRSVNELSANLEAYNVCFQMHDLIYGTNTESVWSKRLKRELFRKKQEEQQMQIDQMIQEEMNILKKCEPVNLALIGPPGLGKMEFAMEIAAEWLKTDQEMLVYHPDFKLIQAEQGVLRAEQAEEIRNKALYLTETKAVCVILNAETMTYELQNKLLKVLEDNADMIAVIFVSLVSLLPTVLSRCIEIRFRKQPFEKLYASLEQPYPFVIYASDGSPGAYHRIMENQMLFQCLQDIFLFFCQIEKREQMKDMLHVTHSIKEKDRMYLPEVLDDWELEAVFNMLSNLFYYALIRRCGSLIPKWVSVGNLSQLYQNEEIIYFYNQIEDAKERLRRKGAYSKNDFFLLLMDMIPIE